MEIQLVAGIFFKRNEKKQVFKSRPLKGMKLDFKPVKPVFSGIGQVFFDVRSRLQNFDCCYSCDQGFEK
jgi:hypothetical protein